MQKIFTINIPTSNPVFVFFFGFWLTRLLLLVFKMLVKCKLASKRKGLSNMLWQSTFNDPTCTYINYGEERYRRESELIKQQMVLSGAAIAVTMFNYSTKPSTTITSASQSYFWLIFCWPIDHNTVHPRPLLVCSLIWLSNNWQRADNLNMEFYSYASQVRLKSYYSVTCRSFSYC